MPGDPRLPRTAPDGTPWPPAAGALRVKARYLLGTKDGREAYEVAKAFGPEQGFSIGYRVQHARKVGRVRHIADLDLYEFSPVLHGANRLARLVSIKGGQPPRLETKATTGVVAAQRRRAGVPVASPCSGVWPAVRSGRARRAPPRGSGSSAAGASRRPTTSPTRPRAYSARMTSPRPTSGRADLGGGARPEALDAEQEWHLESDGTLTRGPRDPLPARTAGRRGAR